MNRKSAIKNLKLSERPVRRQLGSHLLILRVVRAVLCHSLQYPEQLVELHVERIRDHTRGLLEAEASIVVSGAEHSLNQFLVIRPSLSLSQSRKNLRAGR